jgi:hypothetical protein
MVFQGDLPQPGRGKISLSPPEKGAFLFSWTDHLVNTGTGCLVNNRLSF